jgi:hypothetical protein
MRQNLNVRKLNEPNSDVDQNHIPALIKERNKIMEFEGRLLESDLNLAGIKHAMEHADDYLKLFKPNILETNVLVGDWQHEQELTKDQFEVSLQELQMLIRQQSQSSAIMDDFGKKKQARNMYGFKKLILLK